MQGGDISNASPKMLMVHLDVLTDSETKEIKRRFLPGTVTRVERVLNLRAAAGFYRSSRQFDGITLTCFTTDGQPLREWEERLDRLGINPFRYFESYPSEKALLSEMPYMGNSLIGVVDTLDRALTWGSKYMDPVRLNAY